MAHLTLRRLALPPALAILLAACSGSGKSPDVAPSGDPGSAPLAAPPVLKAALVTGAANVQITNYVLVGTTRLSRTVFEYTYRADTVNGGTAAAISASLASSATATTVVDGALDFASVAAGATKTSIDTFTIRQDRTFAFNEAALVWTVTATALSPVGPAIAADPQPQTVPAPDLGVFSVTATGPALEYQWQSSGDGGATWTAIPGAIGANYATGATATSMSGSRYRVVVSNLNGSATSAAATLTVNPTPPPPGADAAGLRIEEVRYLPLPGDAPFIDLVNVGTEPASLQPALLLVGTIPVRLAAVGDSLAPGAHLLVLLDGQDRVEGSTYHAPPEAAVVADAGTVAILDPLGDPIDEVAWGSAPDAVNASGGGFISGPEAGTSLGRGPGATQARDAQAWVEYASGEVTPGADNPPAAVSGTHPLSGAIIGRSRARLSWVPVPGATGYRVQVASDQNFSTLVVDTELASPQVDVSTLAAGTYAWHVQAEFPGSARAGFSAASSLTLTEGSPVTALASPVRVRASSVHPAAAAPDNVLGVPLLDQHKDTHLLMLDSSHPGDNPDNPLLQRPAWDPGRTHLWDAGHPDLNESDPADNMNCSLASLAMMNQFFQGDMSQDRIGYEVFKNVKPGPEKDLNTTGLNGTQVEQAFSFALQRTPSGFQATNLETLWSDVVRLIDQNVPILVGRLPPPGGHSGHVFVIVGHIGTAANQRYIVVNDPWHAEQIVYELGDPAARMPDWLYWYAEGAYPVVKQEASIEKDSDGDGVYDFDETERFHTDPANTDTDQDGVNDWADIYASVFDPRKGYSIGGPGRDFDHDYVPMELDPDADGGGCKDGKEDQDGDGVYGIPAETWNFDPADDTCEGLGGHLQLVVHDYTQAAGGGITGTHDDKTDISVRLDPDPANPGYWLDAGSTYVFRGAHTATYDFGECTVHARSEGSQSGDFTGPSAGFTYASLVPDDSGRLAISIGTGIDGDHTQGWVSGCGLSGSGSPSGDGFGANFDSACWGVPVPGAAPGRQRWVFSCHTPQYDASGDITAVAPPAP